MDINKISRNIMFNNELGYPSAIFLVDVSYYTYARFYATQKWYLFANKDITETIDMSQDWTLNNDFMAKFRALFFKKIDAILRKLPKQIPNNNIIFAVDSPFANNWRYEINATYKENRKVAHERSKFNSWDIFRIVKEELLPKYVKNYNHIIEIPKLEADDVIALMIRELKRIDPTSLTNRAVNYYILANDRDYIQICNDRTVLLDINGNNISDKILDPDCSNMDFLIKKILLGDKSDNIEGCEMKRKMIELADIKSKKETLKCGPAKVRDIMKQGSLSRELVYELLGLLRGNKDEVKNGQVLENELFVNNQFSKNAILIDFALIPSCYYCKCKL